MYRRIHAGDLWLASVAVATFLAVVLQAQEPVFRADVQLVRLLATVKDAASAPIGSLERDSFRVYDNEVEQDISVFQRYTAQPLSIALLVDTSLSTKKDLSYEMRSVSRFFNALFREGNPEDAIALYDFNWAVTLRTPYTRRLERLERSLRALDSHGGTSLYDAIYLASEDLMEREGRHVMVIVTDGGDTTSAKDFHAALESLHRAEAVLYPIVVLPIVNNAGRNTGGEHALDTLAAGTGGRTFYPEIGAQLDAAFSDLLRDLRTQYLIGYYPRGLAPSKQPFHTVRIEVDRPGLRAITRRGYYAEPQDGEALRAPR